MTTSKATGKKRKAESDLETEINNVTESDHQVSAAETSEADAPREKPHPDEVINEAANADIGDGNASNEVTSMKSESGNNMEPSSESKSQNTNEANEGNEGNSNVTNSSAPEKKTTGSDSPFDKIRHVIVTNDGNRDNLVRLVGLKNLFAKQLPKMPKDYIVRLVFDRRHKSLAILSDDPAVKGTDDEIIGGICYRAYHDMRFSEIAFCAVNGNQQVKVS